jgi:hypothetical protein
MLLDLRRRQRRRLVLLHVNHVLPAHAQPYDHMRPVLLDEPAHRIGSSQISVSVSVSSGGSQYVPYGSARQCRICRHSIGVQTCSDSTMTDKQIQEKKKKEIYHLSSMCVYRLERRADSIS